jgi:hypothetical protein
MPMVYLPFSSVQVRIYSDQLLAKSIGYTILNQNVNSLRESRVIACDFSIGINALRAKSFMAISKCDDFTRHRINFIRIQ